MIRIKAFGKIAETTGWDTREHAMNTSVAGWRTWLEAEYPALKGTQYQVALNQRLVSADTLVPDGSELAFLPPFSGG